MEDLRFCRSKGLLEILLSHSLMKYISIFTFIYLMDFSVISGFITQSCDFTNADRALVCTEIT